MTRTFRHTMSALAALALVSVFTSSPTFTQTGTTHAFSSYRLVFGTSRTQFLRVCVSGSPPGASEGQPKIDPVLRGFEVADASGNVVLERELRVPAGEFRCTDIPYAELVAAGLPPDPTTRAITFRVDILSTRGRTEERVAANQTRTIGALMSIDVATGKIESWELVYDLGDTPVHE